MKTRFLIIIVGLSVAGIFGGLYTANIVQNIEDQKAQEEWRELREDMLSEIKKNKISDPICFVVDRSSGKTSGVTMDRCVTLKQLDEMGCTKPMLEHLYRYSNLLDYEPDGIMYLEWAGLPYGISQEAFDKCVDVVLEMRPIFNSNNQLASEPDDFDKTFDGPGNRHPAFLGFVIPEVCTDEMIRHLEKYSSMFERDVPFVINDIGLESGIDANDFDRCVKELLEKNPRGINEN